METVSIQLEPKIYKDLQRVAGDRDVASFIQEMITEGYDDSDSAVPDWHFELLEKSKAHSKRHLDQLTPWDEIAESFWS